MLLAALLSAVIGSHLLAYTVGRIIQFLTTQDTTMASASNAALAAAVTDLLAENAALKATAAQPHPAEAVLADEISAEEALIAQIRASLAAAAPVDPLGGVGLTQ